MKERKKNAEAWISGVGMLRECCASLIPHHKNEEVVTADQLVKQCE